MTPFPIWNILLLSIALAADAFSVGAAVGLHHRQLRQIFRLSFHFGLFQGLLPLTSGLAGRELLRYISSWDHWVAFGTLLFIGIRMIYGALAPDNNEKQVDLTRGIYLVTLSLAVSIDALAAGIGIAAMNIPIIPAVSLIAAVTMLATIIAMRLSGKIQKRWGSRVEILGGLMLIGLAFKMLFTL